MHAYDKHITFNSRYLFSDLGNVNITVTVGTVIIFADYSLLFWQDKTHSPTIRGGNSTGRSKKGGNCTSGKASEASSLPQGKKSV